jgi:hypothetical protein
VTTLGQSFDRCPKAWLRDEAPAARGYLDDWSMLQRHGVMLCGGGLLDQPAIYIEAMHEIDHEVATTRALIAAKGGKG